MNEKETIRVSSGAPWEELVGYSRAVRKGNMIWVSGTTSIQDGIVIGVNDPYAQAVMCLQIIKKAIEAAGGQMSDVVRTRIFVVNISHWEAIGRAHSEYFREFKPATSMIEISKLIDPNLLLEIEAEAMV